MRARATITSKGQLTLPIAIRHRMNLREGDVVEFTLEAGVATLQRHADDTNPFEKWAGRRGGLRRVQDAVNWQRDLRDRDSQT